MFEKHVLPDLDDMLQEVLLIEEGEHEFTPQDGAKDLREFFFPVTRKGIYLNHATQGPLPRPVALTMHEYIDDTSSFGAMHAERWKEYLAGARRRLARFIHARPEQVVLTSGDGLALLISALQWQTGDTIVLPKSVALNHSYALTNLQQNVKIEVVSGDEKRIANAESISQLPEHVRIVILNLVEPSTRLRNDLRSIVTACHERAILCGVAATHALGALDVDVEKLGVDFLFGSSHTWLLAPPQTGLLYISQNLSEQLAGDRASLKSVDGYFGSAFPNTLPIVGFDAALGLFESLSGGMEAVEARILALTEQLLTGLDQLGYPVLSPREAEARSGIVSFKPHPDRPDRTAAKIVQELALRNIFVAVLDESVRVSPHFYNIDAEIDQVLSVLEELKQPEPEK